MQTEEKVEKQDLPNGGRPYIQIAVGENGALSVHGSINDRMVAYGLLEVARHYIDKHLEANAKPKIQPAHGIMDFMRTGKRG